MTTFEGSSEAEIVAAEADLGVRFTDVFRAYLRQMGKSRGHLLCGSNVAEPSRFPEFRQVAQELMHETSQSLELPPDAVVFLTHQGYQFLFIRPDGGFDCPVLMYMEMDEAPKQIADSFAAFLSAEVTGMEETHRMAHENGGHYVTVDDDGSTSFEFPARLSGYRITSEPFRLGE
jgi:hypothetical protein